MLSNGLNIRSKPAASTKPPPKPVSSLFDEDQQDDISSDTTRKKYAVPAKSSLKSAALDENDKVYDYDGVYDAMKSGERESLKLQELDKRDRKPKYMQNLFAMAEVRKQDRLRAEDVKLQREREAEGDEFADAEKFVTGAYRAQQEEARRLQREEEAREAALRSQFAGGTGLAAFQQNLVADDMRKHEAAVKASLEAANSTTIHQMPPHAVTLEDEEAEKEQERLKQAEAKLGKRVATNDDNQVIDHRELLAAGLNRVGTSDKHLQTKELAKKIRPLQTQKEKDDRQAQIDRQQRVLKAQLEESRKRQASEIERQQTALKMQAKRTKTETDISSAKERYLARKKAEAEATNNIGS